MQQLLQQQQLTCQKCHHGVCNHQGYGSPTSRFFAQQIFYSIYRPRSRYSAYCLSFRSQYTETSIACAHFQGFCATRISTRLCLAHAASGVRLKFSQTSCILEGLLLLTPSSYTLYILVLAICSRYRVTRCSLFLVVDSVIGIDSRVAKFFCTIFLRYTIGLISTSITLAAIIYIISTVTANIMILKNSKFLPLGCPPYPMLLVQ